MRWNENEKIEVLLNTDLMELKGETTLEQLVVKNSVTNETQTFDVAALFVFIGVRPQSQLVDGFGGTQREGIHFHWR